MNREEIIKAIIKQAYINLLMNSELNRKNKINIKTK